MSNDLLGDGTHLFSGVTEVNVQVGWPVVITFNYDDEYIWATDLDELINVATGGQFEIAEKKVK